MEYFFEKDCLKRHDQRVYEQSQRQLHLIWQGHERDFDDEEGWPDEHSFHFLGQGLEAEEEPVVLWQDF